MYTIVFTPFDDDSGSGSISSRLAEDGHWPAKAREYLEAGAYTKAVSLCREQLAQPSPPISVRLTYARALQETGQKEAAAEILYEILTLDPDNLVALKGLADFHFENGDEMTAILAYERILSIDPFCGGLHCAIRRPQETTRTLTLAGKAEGVALEGERLEPILVSETLGDLYFAQGHNRMAAEIFRRLNERSPHQRIKDKLARSSNKTREKEIDHVHETH